MSLPQTYKAIVGNEKGEVSVKEFPLPKPSNNQVLVKVEFAPLNPTDFMKLNGFYGKPEDYGTALNGSEGSGVVVAVGNNLKYPFKVGDRVHIWGEGWGQYVLLESDKASVEVPATSAGTITAINLQIGDKVKEGDVILTIDSGNSQSNTAPVEQPTQQTDQQADQSHEAKETKEP